MTLRRVEDLMPTLTSGFSRYFSPSLAVSRRSSSAVVTSTAETSPINGMEILPVKSTS